MRQIQFPSCWVIVAFFLFWGSALVAQASVPKGIEEQLQHCLAKYPGTSSEAGCYREQALAWEKEVERLYQALGGDRNAALKHSHLLWQNYLTSERLYLEQAFFVPGSQSQWLKARATYGLFKNRAEALQHYLDFVNAHQ